MKHDFPYLKLPGRGLAGTILLLLCALLVRVEPASATDYYQAFEQDGLKVTIDVSGSLGSPGYLPINLDITNALGDRVIEITATSQRFYPYSGGYYGGRAGSLDVSQTVRLKKGDRVRLTLPLPVSAENENVQVQIRERNRVLHAFPFSFNTMDTAQNAPTLLVANASSAFGKVAQSLIRTSFPAGAAGRFGGAPVRDGIDVGREPHRLPTNWLGFTTLRAVFIGAPELDELSEAQRDALMAWTAAGGDLIVVGGDLEKLFRDPQRRPAGIGFGKGAERYFLGQILFASVEDLASKGIDRTLGDLANNGPNGQRTPWFPPDRFISNEASSGLRKTDTGARSPFAAWQLPVNNVTQERYSYMEDPTRHGFKLPIPGVGGVSTRVYLGILVVFTVIIGPANYMYLKRTRQQVLMVLTTPAISLAFILLLAGYALAGEGFGMHARAESFTFLDQASKQAVTRATVSLYAAGMAPWNGAQFPKDAAVFPLASGGQQMTLDLTDVQQYSSGLMQARTPINFEEIVVRTARERLTFSREGAGISVVNALGVPIKQLVYREGGTVYALKDAVPVGGRGVLERGAGPGLDRLLKPDKPLAGPDTMYIDRSDKFQHFFIDSLADGAFFAVVDRSPFWEPGVSNIVEQGSFHIVAGYAGGEP